MALFNNFPYSNTEEINLDYTLNKLNELYSHGENLYAELQAWKTETDEANEAWKSNLITDINKWQNSVTQSLEQWKSSVDSEMTEALTTLSNQITEELARAKADLRAEVADLASAAAASSANAAASQSAAAQSAQSAINSAAAAAQSEQNITESAEQIETNKNDITDLKSALDDVDNRVTDIDGIIPVDVNDFEIGSITINGSGWTYAASPNRVRTKEGVIYHLKVGQKIGLTDYTDATYYIGWKTSDNTYGYHNGWLATDFNAEVEGDYVICIRNLVETAQESADDLASLVFIKQENTLSDEVDDIKNQFELIGSATEYVDIPYDKYMVDNKYIGTRNGTTIYIANQNGYCYFKIPVKKGEKFKTSMIVADNTIVCSFVMCDVNDSPISIKHDATVWFDDYIYTVSNDGWLYISAQNASYTHYSIKKLVSIKSVYPLVSCVGDSLTQGNQDASGITYPNVLASLLGDDYFVANHGCGGDDSTEIAAVTNAVNFFVKPFTIPASATQTVVELDIPAHGTSENDPAVQNINQLSTSIINGVPVRFYYASGTYKIARQDNGNESVVVSRPTEVTTSRSRERLYTTIIWAGTNDVGLNASNMDGLFNSIDAIISMLNTNNYIVIGITAKVRFSDVADINLALERKYGSHFLNVRDYILAYGLDDANITPTEQDTADLANGEIPSSLRSDSIHLNQYGYTIVGNLVYQRGKDLRYWN